MSDEISITFTGIDERTDLQRVRQLQAQGAEIGILLTASPDGRNRYPRYEWIVAAMSKLGPRVALHVCGRQARANLLHGLYDRILGERGAMRVQVNGLLDRWQISDLLRKLRPRGVTTLITQHHPANGELALFPDARDHALLVGQKVSRERIMRLIGHLTAESQRATR